MDIEPTAAAGPAGIPHPKAGPIGDMLHRIRRSLRDRILGGIFFVLPIVLTFWVLRWCYSGLEYNVIEPIAQVVLWKLRWIQSATELPYWFERYAAPVIAILILLIFLYCLGFFVSSRLRRSVDWVLLRMPVVSFIYDSFRSVFLSLEKPPGPRRPQKMVLVSFPHPGIKVPAFVTATCRDIETHKALVCVYVPTTPVPTSGFFLLVPEEEVTELNWSIDQTLQAVMSGGLTAPPEVRYFKNQPSQGPNPAAPQVMDQADSGK
jgi:uncharacterized membrane protein